MKTLKEYSKDAILAVLGTVDEQNEDIKDLLRRGTAIMGMGMAENEELCYNGNREEIERRRAAREEEERRKRSIGGVELSYNREYDYDGEGGMRRTLEMTTQSENKIVAEETSDEDNKTASEEKNIAENKMAEETSADEEIRTEE